MMDREYITSKDINIKKQHQERLKSLIESSIKFTKSYEKLQDFKFNAYISKDDVFNASCIPKNIQEKDYELKFNSKSYDAIYNALNVLLYEKIQISTG